MKIIVLIVAVILLAIPHAEAVNYENITINQSLLDRLGKISWAPGSKLIELNSQFNGITNSPPTGAITEKGVLATAWVKFNGFDREVVMDGKRWRYKNALPLIQRGHSGGSEDKFYYEIDNINNKIRIVYVVTYVIVFWDESGSWTIRYWVTVDRTWDIVPVHPSGQIVSPNVTIIKDGYEIVVPLNNSMFCCNYDIYFNDTAFPRNGTSFLERRRIIYQIKGGEGEAYYAEPFYLYPNEKNFHKYVYVFNNTESLKTRASANFTNLTYYDPWGYPYIVTNSTTRTESEPKGTLGDLIVVMVILGTVHHLIQKTRRLR